MLSQIPNLGPDQSMLEVIGKRVIGEEMFMLVEAGPEKVKCKGIWGGEEKTKPLVTGMKYLWWAEHMGEKQRSRKWSCSSLRRGQRWDGTLRQTSLVHHRALEAGITRPSKAWLSNNTDLPGVLCCSWLLSKHPPSALSEALHDLEHYGTPSMSCLLWQTGDSWEWRAATPHWCHTLQKGHGLSHGHRLSWGWKKFKKCPDHQ